MSKIPTVIGWLIAFPVGVYLGVTIVKTLNPAPVTAATELTGYVIDKPAYVAACSKADVDFTAEEIDKYCGCTYDTGVAMYGGEKYTVIISALGTSGVVTPEMSAVVNKCVAEL